jgi:hypothetical protein
MSIFLFSISFKKVFNEEMKRWDWENELEKSLNGK